MIVFEQPDQFRRYLDEARAAGKRVGFHPTMGALHGGHLCNIHQVSAECDVAAVSIYANPLQFGPGEDYEAYPRDLHGDLAKSEEAGADVVFVPPTMFAGEPMVTVHVKRLSEILEGSHRPGHFDGVATIVTKLLCIAGPCSAYFGEKDYQQLLLVRRLVEDLSLPVAVVQCPVVREPDGLALSSRNAYLSAVERAAAPVLYWSLLAGKRAVEEEGVTDAKLVRSAMVEVAAREPLVKLEYAAVTAPGDLKDLEVVGREARLLVAGRLGGTRLIDNVEATTGED